MPYSPARIERREFKFLISREIADEVRARLPSFCVLDPYAERMPGHRYTIESLYLDTPNLALYDANNHERLDRFKLRVRHYPNRPTKRVFFEVKRRYHDIILKTRGKVPVERWQRLLEAPFAPTGLLGGDPAAERFVAMVHHYLARPVALVRYEREAWASVVDDYARVTFDQRICSQPARGVSFDHAPSGWRMADHPEFQHSMDSLTVLELKFTNATPTWMVNIVQRLDLWRRSFSKYGTAVRAWYEMTPTDRALRM